MAPKRKKREKTALEKLSDKTLLRSIKKDLHTLILEAEGVTVRKPKKGKG